MLREGRSREGGPAPCLERLRSIAVGLTRAIAPCDLGDSQGRPHEGRAQQMKDPGLLEVAVRVAVCLATCAETLSSPGSRKMHLGKRVRGMLGDRPGQCGFAACRWVARDATSRAKPRGTLWAVELEPRLKAGALSLGRDSLAFRGGRADGRVEHRWEGGQGWGPMLFWRLRRDPGETRPWAGGGCGNGENG